MYFIDSHCHIDRLNYKTIHNNVEDVLFKANQYCIKKFLTVSTSIKNFYKIQKLLKNYHSIFYSCGIHPLNARKELEKFHDIKSLSEKIHKLSLQSNVIAIGETGLDYHYVNEKKNIQQDLFRQHIKLAKKLKKPIIVHSRNATQDIIKILREEQAEQCQGIIHSFSEDYTSACKLLDIGFYISFSGMITFKNSFKLHEVVKKIPLNFFLIETDSPFLSPSPYRGKENQPAYLIEIAKKIASLKNLDLEEIATITTKNFYTLFNVKK